MGVIEQAARRLEELRRAGVDIPDAMPMPTGAMPDPAASATSTLPKSRAATTAARPARAQPPAWWVDTIPDQLLDEANADADAAADAAHASGHTAPGMANGHARQSHGVPPLNGFHTSAIHALDARLQATVDVPDGVTDLVPSIRTDLQVRREQPVQPHSDSLPQSPIETGVAMEADAPERALMVRDERSVRVGIDVLRLARDGFLVPGTPQGTVAEEFRGIKRALLRSIGEAAQMRVRRPNLVMITSARPREGKTFVALNLALSIAAEVDHSALLVDLDSAQSGVMVRTGLPRDQPGVIELLTQSGRLPVSQVMLATQIPKLSLLPAGAANSHSSELLSSVAMDALLDDLARRYRDRVVIFDAPPLLGATEVAMLASQVGQVVMVVAQEQTPLDDVRRAFDKVIDCPRVMSVFNRAATLGVMHGHQKAEVAHA